MKILVNLGAVWGIELDNWSEKYNNNEAFDKLPYGYCWVESENVEIEYLKLNKIEKKLLFNINLLMKIYFYLFKTPLISFKYDCIWTHNDKEALIYGFLKKFKIFKKLPPVISNIIWLTDKELSKKKKNKYGNYLNNIDKIVVLSKAQINVLKKNFGVEEEKVNFITYGLNKEIYSDKLNVKKPKNIKWDNNYILMVGTDIHRDVNTFKEIARTLKKEKFIFASNNDNYLNGNYSFNVQTMKCSLSEMKWLYSNCKYVIMPLKRNYHASGCTTLIEVGLQNKAIVTNNILGLEDYFEAGETAEVINDSSTKSFLNAIEKLEDDKYRNTMEIKAKKYFINNNRFSSREYAKSFLKLTNELLCN